MTEYRTILTTDEIDTYVKSVPENQVLFLPTNKVIYAKRKDHNITLKGLFFSTRARIKNTDNQTTVEMKTRFRLPFYFISLFLLVFFSMAIFADKVTINGNSDPSLVERLGFVLVGLIMFSIPVGIFVKLKSDFVRRIENELKLKKTNANKT